MASLVWYSVAKTENLYQDGEYCQYSKIVDSAVGEYVTIEVCAKVNGKEDSCQNVTYTKPADCDGKYTIYSHKSKF
jgi:hypothetical protein